MEKQQLHILLYIKLISHHFYHISMRDLQIQLHIHKFKAHIGAYTHRHSNDLPCKYVKCIPQSPSVSQYRKINTHINSRAATYVCHLLIKHEKEAIKNINTHTHTKRVHMIDRDKEKQQFTNEYKQTFQIKTNDQTSLGQCMHDVVWRQRLSTAALQHEKQKKKNKKKLSKYFMYLDLRCARMRFLFQ